MAETWYWRTGTGAACGPGTRRPLDAAAGSSGSTEDVTSEHTWNRTESARTIAAGNWSVFADLQTASGGGAPNRVTVVLERRNSSCVVQQTIGSFEATMSAGTTQEYQFDFGDPGAVTFASGEILTCRMVRTNGGRAQTLHFNAASGTGDTRLVHPDEQAASVTGSGALLAQASAASGSGVSESTGTGGLAAQAVTLAGSGVSLSTGTGALVADDAIVQGASSPSGSGALVAQDSTVAGLGVSLSIGTGVLVVQSAALSGAGVSQSSGVGVLVMGASGMSGSGESGSTGTGALTSADALVMGAQVASAAARVWQRISVGLGIGI